MMIARVLAFVLAATTTALHDHVSVHHSPTPPPVPHPEPAFDGVLRTEPDGRLSGYMIPPACPEGTPCVNSSSHCASLVTLPDGTLALGWFSGYREGWNLTAVVISYLKPGATRWSSPTVVSRRPSFSSQNPVLFFDDDAGELVMFHVEQPSRASMLDCDTVNAGGVGDCDNVNDGGVGGGVGIGGGGGGDPVPQQESQGTLWVSIATNTSTSTAATASSGNGWVWGSSTLFDGAKGTWGRNQIVKRLDGTWMLPLYNESEKALGHQYEYSLMLTKPKAASTTSLNGWGRLQFNDTGYLVQPSVMRLKPNESNLLVYFRDRRALNIYMAKSSDDGYHWSSPVATALPNNNAGVHATALKSGAVVIVYNNMTGDPGHDFRNQLVVSLSDDGGNTFTVTRALEIHPGTPSSNHLSGIGPTSCDCYSYPWVTQSDNGDIHIAYTYERRTIKYMRVSEIWIRSINVDAIQL